MLVSFIQRYEKLIADHPDAETKMDLMRAFVVQIGQLVQNSSRMNGIVPGGNNKRTELKPKGIPSASFWMDRRYIPAYFTATYKKMRDSLQPSRKESGRKMFRKQNKTNAERESETLKTCAAPRNRRGYL
jgi:hypothetical protein